MVTEGYLPCGSVVDQVEAVPHHPELKHPDLLIADLGAFNWL